VGEREKKRWELHKKRACRYGEESNPLHMKFVLTRASSSFAVAYPAILKVWCADPYVVILVFALRNELKQYNPE